MKKAVFHHPKQALSLRLLVFLLASIVLMIADHRLDYLRIVRTHLLGLVYPIQYLVNLPIKTSQWLSMTASNRFLLIEEIQRLRADKRQLQVTLQKFETLKSENERLRRLLGSPLKVGERVQMAEVLAVELEHSRRKITINKGKNDGVIVQVVRTGLRTVAKGIGAVNRLSLLGISNTGLDTGIKVGDLIVTSGAGEKFPKDYPVGTVVEATPDIGQPFASVQALPRAVLERNSEVLLVW